MSSTLGKIPRSNPFGRGGVFNKTGRASPTRLAVAGGIGTLLLGCIVVVSFMGQAEPPQSQTARMPPVNPLPGGMNTNANQDRLSLVSTIRSRLRPRIARDAPSPRRWLPASPSTCP